MTNHSVIADISSDSNSSSKTRFPIQDRKSFEKDFVAGLVTDEELDQNYKIILRDQKNGAYLSPEIVAHLEYFMNTLNLMYRSKTVNPFEKVVKYPALLFKGISKVESFSGSSAPTGMHDESSDSASDVPADLVDEAVMLNDLKSKSAEGKTQNDLDSDQAACLRRASIKNEVAK